MAETATGGCLCGAVRFEIAGTFDAFFLCHCERCRKRTGSAHAANLFSSGARLTWLAGTDRIRTYRVPGTRHETNFCADCGAPVPGGGQDGAFVVVPAGSLETRIDIRPTAHIHCESRAEWDHDLADVPETGGGPVAQG